MSNEEGVTLTLDRFDPGRAQPGTRVPSLVLPGDVVVPVEFVLHGASDPYPMVRPSDLSITLKRRQCCEGGQWRVVCSGAARRRMPAAAGVGLYIESNRGGCFDARRSAAALQQACSGGDGVELFQLLGVRGQVSCSQQGDQLGFSLHWIAASCASAFDMVGVRPLPIIPTALARSLSSQGPQRHRLKPQRGFLTMDQTRKLLLLLESDPKAGSLPSVGVWLSGVVQPSNPQVWAWCLRFFHSSSLHDRVLSDQGWFLLVVFPAGPGQAQFYQCRCAGKRSGHMDFLLLSSSLNFTCFKFHPSIFFRLSGVGSRGQQPKQGSPDFPFPSYFGQLFLGDPEAFPGQPRDIKLRADLIHPRGPATEELPDHLGNLSPRDRRAHTRVPRPCFLTGRRVGGIEEVFEVSLPPIHNVPSRGQQRTVSTIHSVDDALLPPPETPDGGPEPLRSRPEVVLHGLTELLPCPGFCLGNRHSCAPLGLPVPACCLRSPTGQKGPIGLLLQFDGIPHRRCPPAGSGIAATAGTDHLAATALVGRLNNGGVEHGPLGLNVPRLPRYMVKALPEVGVEALSDRRLCQTFPADPHDTFGSARSDRHSPPPSQPTHHQVVIS
ncbi:SCL-interrupting locus [Merluccius polli]|uniref:SCL-interrupting locus n=1 Tax=Merluccius polli TaxID=89951 RepID=A0AA47MSC1_MERPO|nr:SCL-interrupting locus [Merluccius polli]